MNYWLLLCKGEIFVKEMYLKAQRPHSAGKFVVSSAVFGVDPQKLPSPTGTSHRQHRKLRLQTSGLTSPGPLSGLYVVAELGPP